MVVYLNENCYCEYILDPPIHIYLIGYVLKSNMNNLEILNFPEVLKFPENLSLNPVLGVL